MSVLSESIKQRIREHFDRYPSKQAVTLPALHMVQQELRCVPAGAIEEIAELLELSPAQVYDTMSFYGFFRDEDKPLGKRRVWICRSLPCMLRGGDELLAEVCDRLHISPGGNAKNDQVTIELAECLGACEMAPCMLIEDEVHPAIDADHVLQVAEGKS
jgi:NADH-quinone oxidoreductase subunit E